MATLAGTAPAAEQRQPSPKPNGIALSSRNPFRNKTGSPTLPTPPQSQNIRPTSPRMSNNPFLDASEISTSPPAKESSGNGLTADIFRDLSLLDKPASNGAAPPPPNMKAGGPTRSGTLPPQAHRPMGSDDRRRPPPSRGPESPSKKEPRQRPRGMSESSVMDEKGRDRRDRDRGERPPRTESEERRRRERRAEREDRHKREKEKIRKGDRSMKKPQGLDIIDKLDVTGIYGQGLFHHDGPFDACNPHRNARKDRRAPMQAFPAGSANMALGGAGPLNSRLDLDKFHGRGEESFSEYGAARKKPTTNIIDPTARIEPVHGDETMGLGTSTFLEGAPATKSALQRRESEDQQTYAESNALNGGGLTRKKSLVQRFRGMSASRRAPGDFRSPEARYGDTLDSSPPNHGKAISAGGPLRAQYTKENEVNPFFDTNDYDAAFEKKGAQIKIAEASAGETPGASSEYRNPKTLPIVPNSGRMRAPSSPNGGMGLVRSVTADSSAVRGSSNEEERGSSGGGGVAGGFLNRMRSLKGGRRTRPERRDT